MQASLKTSPKTSLQNHPNYRVVTVSQRQGQVGMLVPHANFLIPDKQAIRDLSEIMQLYEKLKPATFNYGSSSGYERSTGQLEQPAVKPLPQINNPFCDLPLFKKPSR